MKLEHDQTPRINARRQLLFNGAGLAAVIASPLSEGIRQHWWRQGMMGSIQAHYEGIKAFSETDFTGDLRKIDVPTFVMHGDDDQIVPISDSGLLTAKIVRGSKLKVYPGFPHGMCATNPDQINADLLAFFRS